jgi:hypothetical protein
MEIYYKKRPRADAVDPPTQTTCIDGNAERLRVLSSEYDRYRQSLLETDKGEGWSSELRHYLKDRPGDVTKDTDIINWWQVSRFGPFYRIPCLTLLQNHAALYPTLARMALDILPSQASSVPCERLFSASKQTADLRRASLGAKRFEELQIMKFAWRKNNPDHSAQNWAQIEEVQLGEYCEILEVEETLAEWDQQLLDADEFILED